MAEWLYEAGIGEARAALVEDGAIIEAAIELEDGALRAGAILPAKLVETTRRGGLLSIDGREAVLTRLSPGLSTGRKLLVEIVREAIPEAGRVKPARATPSDAAERSAPTLLERIIASGMPVRTIAAHQPDALEAAGWSELLDEAMTGEIAFDGGALRLSPTPAMTLFDVDGEGDAESLAVAAATAVARAIRRMAIGGSIGIDFPTLAGKAARHAVAAAIDAGLPAPFERTAVNGFGFLQIVRPRVRASLPERVRADPVAAATRAALRILERIPPGAPNAHRITPPVRDCLDRHPEWIAELVRRTGRAPMFDA